MDEVWEKRIAGRAVRIRFATMGDFDYIKWIDKTVRGNKPIPLLLSGELEAFINSKNVLVAEITAAKRIIGFIIFEDIQHGVYIRRVMVPPSPIKGIGTALILLGMKYLGKGFFKTIPEPENGKIGKIFRRLAMELQFEFIPTSKSSAYVAVRAPSSMGNEMVKSKIEEVLTKKYGWQKVS